MNQATKKILIVDDDAEFLSELSESLRLYGFQVIDINDPSCALELARLEKPDLILLDMKMPKTSGAQIAYELKSAEELKKIPVMAMSAYFKMKSSGLLEIYGIKECLHKPFDIDTAVAKMKTLMDSVDGT